jgi:hypothetical protein
LPRLAEELLRKKTGLPPSRRVLRPIESLASRLDDTVPGWQETAIVLMLGDCRAGVPSPAENILHTAAGRGDPALQNIGELSQVPRVAASLLALKCLTFHSPLCHALATGAEPCHRELAALALFSTDTREVRTAYRRAFASLMGKLCLPDSCEARAMWLIFARFIIEHTLTYKEFRSLALVTQIFQPEGYPRSYRPGSIAQHKLIYHPSLDLSGLSRLPEMRRLYSMLVAELVPAVSANAPAWIWLRWMRCFPGADYFFEALARLEEVPNDLTALFVLCWAQQIGEDSPDFSERLARHSALLLMLVSLLRPHLEETIGGILDAPLHKAFLQWLRLPCRQAAESEAALCEVVQPWAERFGSLLINALGPLCAIDIPTDEPELGAQNDASGPTRLHRFLALHLTPDFPNFMDNVLLIQGLQGVNLEALELSAKTGRLAAIRALGLADEISEQATRTLVELSSRGGEPERRAAKWALERIAARHDLGGLEALMSKLDMAAAWENGGLVDAPTRVWWDIADHRIKLSLANGKVEVSAWGPAHKKNIPAKVRAHPLFAQVQEARKVLTRAYGIFRNRLEDAMLTGESFAGRQFELLLTNAAFRSLAERLVLKVEDEELLLEGAQQEGLDGIFHNAQSVRVLHPMELCHAGRLEYWQEQAARRHILQPFKQCFREIYPVEANESQGSNCSRFFNQLILARKAYALLRRRGYSPCQGDAYRDWRKAGLRAHFIWAQESDQLWQHIAGSRQALPVVSGSIYFERLDGAGAHVLPEVMPLREIDPIVFSETLRDADLVVSSAVAGEEGFSSRQTMEIRAALVRIFARMLNLSGVNVESGASQAVIQGARARYRLHLGSGRVLIEPTGRYLAVPRRENESLPMLPEEQSDSRTLAILEAVEILSHDKEISDPDFLAALAR